MLSLAEAADRLRAIPGLELRERERLAPYTRFGLGGEATLFCVTSSRAAFVEALNATATVALPRMVIGGGTNLVVSDEGFDGIVLQFAGCKIEANGTKLTVEAGAVLQDVVDRSIELGLQGLQTMTGIPGFTGGAVYGNAGAYGHSINELVRRVDFVRDGRVASFDNTQCGFTYRHSRFKDHKEWVILSTELQFERGDRNALARTAAEIRALRDAKYPPTMKCAGSIFKNVFFANLPPATQALIPPNLIREGKVPSAFFLEQVGAKGIRRGDIQVATYHANLIYNDGKSGRASDLVAVIQELKTRVRERFAFEIEEEVQYVGFDYAPVAS
ncbi:MAG: UDP-N-acetylmuramate dehydrogenase [Bryobacteraceae bacterium]